MTKHEYLCRICEVVAEKSSCSKRKVGAVFVNQQYEILATGYNATPKGFVACTHFHSSEEKCLVTIHAEQNAIVQAAKRGTALANSILYCTYLPCVDCVRLLINLGVKEVTYQKSNKDGGLDLLQVSSIRTLTWEEKACYTK
jgi:dCMP deaminase